MKQAPHHIAHEQQRYQHRHQRKRQRNDGEADLARAFQCCLQRIHGFQRVLQIAGDVFDHDDGVIDHETGRHCQRHEGQVIDGKPGQVHDAEGADQRQRHDHRRYQRGSCAAQKQKDDHHHQRNRQQQFELHIPHRRAYGDGAVGQHLHIHARRHGFAQQRQLLLNTLDCLNHIRTRLALYVHDDGRFVVGPGRQPVVLRRLHDISHVTEPQRIASDVSQHHALVVFRGPQLVVRVQAGGARCAVDIALGHVHVRQIDGVAHIVQRQACRRQGLRVHLHPHRRTLPARNADQAHAADLGQAHGQAVFHQIMDQRHRHVLSADRQRHHRRIRRVDLAIARWHGQIRRQKICTRIDSGLHLLLGHVQWQFQ